MIDQKETNQSPKEFEEDDKKPNDGEQFQNLFSDQPPVTTGNFRESERQPAQQWAFKQVILQQYLRLFQCPTLLSLFFPQKKRNNRELELEDEQGITQKNLSILVDKIWKENHIQKIKQEQLSKLIANNFIIMQNNDKAEKGHHLKIKIIQKTKNCQIIELFCQLGKLSKKYIVINVIEQSFRHHYHSVGRGAFGQILACKTSSGQKVVAKCLKFKENQVNIIRNFINEFMIADLMSAAEIGPKIIRRNGFDFVLFSDCLEFDMEMCSETRMETLQEDLKINLFKMHLLKVVHSDIKPGNVMYSEHYKKNVFLDFGLASVLSQQVWQDTVTDFKGTYEFSGEKMKEIFMSNKTQMVNLYLNDGEMLINTLKKLLIDSKFKEIIYEFRYKEKYLETETLEKEFIMRFKFYFYRFEVIPPSTQKFKILINDFQNLLEEKKKEKILKEIQTFLNEIDQSTKEIIFAQFLWKDIDGKNLLGYHQDLSYENKFSFQDYKKNSKSKQEYYFNEFIRDLYEQLEKDEQNQHSFEDGIKTKRKMKNNKHNLQFILTNVDQIQHFEQQDYLGMILEYVSFWKSSFKVQIEQKQIVAKMMRSIFQPELGQKKFAFRYFDSKYLPEEPFIASKCHHLVWMYAYFLSYCMEGEFDDFKSNNLMTIVKDCIFLSFKYHFFIPECLKKYLLFIILKKPDFLITQAVIQCSEIVYLTQKHFLISSKEEISYRNKIFALQLEIFFEQMAQKEVQATRNESNQVLRKKLSILKDLQGLFVKKNIRYCIYEKSFQKDFRIQEKVAKFFTTIQKEFQRNGNLDNINFFSKAVKMLYFTNLQHFTKQKTFPYSPLLKPLHHFELFEEPFDVLRLMSVKLDHNQKINQSNINYIEEKINVKQISLYFLLPQKFTLHHNKRDIQAVQTIMNAIFFNYESALLNFNVFYKVSNQRVKIMHFCILKKDMKKITIKRGTTMRIVEFFSCNPQKYIRQLLQCTQILDRDELFDPQIRIHLQEQADREIKTFQKLFNKCYEQKGFNILTYNVASYILDSLRQNKQYPTKYYEFRLKLLKMVFVQNVKLKLKYELFKKKNSSQNKNRTVEKYQNQEQIKEKESFVYFQNQLSNMHLLGDVIENHEENQIFFSEAYWKIKKIKLSICNQYRISLPLPLLIKFFFEKQSLHQLFQVLIQYCAESCEYKGIQYYKFMCRNLISIRQILNPHQTHRFVHQFTKYLFELEATQKNKIDVKVLFTINISLLYYNRYLNEDFLLYKKLLLKVCNLYPQFISSNDKLTDQISQTTIKQHSIKQILFFQMKYVEKTKNRRKNVIVLRNLIKNFIQGQQHNRPHLKKYLNQFVFKLIKKPSNRYLETKIYTTYLKSSMKFILNSFSSEIEQQFRMNETTVRQQYQKYYQKYFPEKFENILIEDHYQNINQDLQIQCVKHQFKQIIEQTTKIRNKIQKQQLEIFCQKLYLEKGKRFNEISWIKRFNE